MYIHIQIFLFIVCKPIKNNNSFCMAADDTKINALIGHFLLCMLCSCQIIIVYLLFTVCKIDTKKINNNNVSTQSLLSITD